MKQLAGLGIVAGIFVVVLSFAITFGQIWVIGSLIVSGVKPLADDCGKTYKIERVLDGTWFCEDTATK